MWPPTQAPHISIDSMSARQSSSIDAYGSNYSTSRREGDNDRDNDNARNDGGDFGQQDQNHHLLSPFTSEVVFTHYNQDEDRGSWRADPSTRAIESRMEGRDNKGRQHLMMTSFLLVLSPWL